MKTKQSFTFRLAAMLMLHAMLVLTVFAPYQMAALDVQTLPTDTRATSGFTHAARVTWDDLNASDNAATVIQLYGIPTNTYIDRVAWYIEEGFTNSTTTATNLLLCIGTGGSTTNFFFTTNQIDAATANVVGGVSLFGLSTNTIIAYKSTTSTNYLTATFSAAASVVDTYTVGKIRIYWRVVEPAKYKF